MINSGLIMIENKWLRQAKTVLSGFYCYLKDDDILVVSEDKATLPHTFIMTDTVFPNTLLLSFAVDYPNASVAASIALHLTRVTKVALVENFYISKHNGTTFWGDDALKYYSFESQIALEEIEPESQARH